MTLWDAAKCFDTTPISSYTPSILSYAGYKKIREYVYQGLAVGIDFIGNNGLKITPVKGTLDDVIKEHDFALKVDPEVFDDYYTFDYLSNEIAETPQNMR